MKAIILNSGIGKRMGAFTLTHHKSMASITPHETIFERQLRILHSCGIRDFLITTGPFADQLKEKAQRMQFADCRFTWVENPIYDQTNYIYSLYLARDYIDSESLLLHGDLVFNQALVEDVLQDARQNLGTVQPLLPLPDKDFKARLSDAKIKEISVKIFGNDCCSFQPFYKLSYAVLCKWMNNIEKFVNKGDTQVYAENALNELLDEITLETFDSSNHFINEVDTLEDLEWVSKEINIFDHTSKKSM